MHVRLDKERQIKAVLVATKTDLPTQRHAVSLQAAQDWATANGMDFCATSAVRVTWSRPVCVPIRRSPDSSVLRLRFD